MGTISAFKCAEIIQNVRNVLAIELMCSSQGLDFINDKPGSGVAIAHHLIREKIPTLTQDRIMSYDLEKIAEMIDTQSILKKIESSLGALH
jgi:histidine ammonia-lyase